MPKHQLSIDIPLPSNHPLRVAADAHRVTDAARRLSGEAGNFDLADPAKFAINLLNLEIDLPEGIELADWLKGNKPLIDQMIRDEIARQPITDPITFDSQQSDKKSIVAHASSPQLDALRASLTKRLTSFANVTGASSDPSNPIPLATARKRTGMRGMLGGTKDIASEDIATVGDIVASQSNSTNPEFNIEVRQSGKPISRISSRPIVLSDRVSMDVIKEMLSEGLPGRPIQENRDGTISILTGENPPKLYGKIEAIDQGNGTRSLTISGSFIADFKDKVEKALFKEGDLTLADSPTFDDSVAELDIPEIPEQAADATLAQSSSNPLFKQKHGDPKSAEIYQAQKDKFEELYTGIASKYDSDCSSAQADYEAKCKSEYIEHLAQIPGLSVDGNNLKHDDTVIGTIAIDVKGTPCCSITPNKEFAALCRQFQKEADALPGLDFSPFVPPEKPEIPEFRAPAAPIPIPMPTSGDPNEAIGKLFSAYDAKGDFELSFGDDGKISVLSNGTKICEASLAMQGDTPHLYLSNPENIHQDMAAFGKQFAEHIGQNRWLQYEAPKEEAKVTPRTLTSEVCDHPTVTVPDAPAISDDLQQNAEYKASFDSAVSAHHQACSDAQKEQMLASIKEQVLAATNAKIPAGRGKLSVSEDGKIILNKGDSATEIGSLDVRLSDGKWSVDITPNEGKAQLCRVLHLQANTMQFKQPEIQLPEFKAPEPPNISIPLPDGDPQTVIAKICENYDAEGKEFQIHFGEDAISLMHNGERVADIGFDPKDSPTHMVFTNRSSLTTNLQEISAAFASDIAKRVKLDAPKEEARIAPNTLSSEICDHPSVTIPDAPEPEEHVKGNAEYLASRDAAYATHLQACEQSAVDQMRESIKEQVLAAANAKIPKGRGELSISEEGKLMLNKGDSATELGSFDVQLTDGKWSVDITPNEGQMQMCRVLHLQANTMQFKQPKITLPEFKAPTPPAKKADPLQQIKTMTFAKERATRIANKAETKRIAAMQMHADLKPGDWRKVADAFIKHMNGLKNKEAEYAKGDTSPSYMKAYQDEGKNFYQAMNIQKVSDTQIRISGTDPDLGGETYCTDIHYNPSTQSVTTRMDAPASDKQILATAEYMRQVALKSGGNTLTISASDDMDGLKRTISIFNSQGLNVELSPTVREDLKEHIRRELTKENEGKIPSQKDIAAEFEKIMKDKYVEANPATTPPPPPSEPQARSSAPSQKQPRMK